MSQSQRERLARAERARQEDAAREAAEREAAEREAAGETAPEVAAPVEDRRRSRRGRIELMDPIYLPATIEEYEAQLQDE